MARFAMIAAIAFVAVLCTRSSAQQPACTPAIVSLSPCIAFVTGNSSFPTSPCCSQLSTVIQTQARCLCTFLSSGAAQLGFKINQTQALTLPGACKIQTPPLSQCNAVAGAPAPATSPEGAPAPAPVVPSSSTNISPGTASTPSEQSPSAPIVPSVPSSPSSPTTPSTPTTVTPSDGGVKTVPTTSSQSSGVGSSTPCVFMFLLLVASIFSSF